jgi:hypothetical protein
MAKLKATGRSPQGYANPQHMVRKQGETAENLRRTEL